MDLVEQALLSLPPHPHVLVLSDSQGYLAALAQGPLRQRTHRGARLWARLSACPARITLRYVFAHVGTPANEAADALVQKSIDSQPLPHPPAWEEQYHDGAQLAALLTKVVQSSAGCAVAHSTSAAPSSSAIALHCGIARRVTSFPRSLPLS